ncbi:N-acyl-D-amino-acid deacylase family protein [Rhodoplanes sp. Z2-YC6860]|uniref:N-acyl-D-amino-acid deacylase family protein n=1 Tax=Rhodoplanes sp. Z2-YC6860 TaxID=674703 RepID=UPI00078B6D9B|nr:D-aminoacylase [Rhodoplanes sp. Z2-YC6860]AMN43235.1 N-acyl-D-amino-acid deacylase [Rhodoplanes sp. Z2-YC6860]
MHDILIRGGLLFDGSGAAGVRGDVAIDNGRIAAIGATIAEPARKTIDAEGLAVAPGFIDIKTHSDFTLPINPKAESKVRQGVTTEIIGHCGFSVAPCLAGKVELLKDYLSPSAPWTPFRELTFPQYLDTFPATSVNAGMLVGHNTLRLMAMGMADRAPTAAELDAMLALLEDGLKAGALGMSSGLFTPPGSYTRPDEMHAFGRLLKKYNAAYFTHLRDESNQVLESVEEAIDVADKCGVHVEIVHFKCSGTDNWGKAETALTMIADARARGLDVDCDAYPYAAGSNPLKNLLPQWVQAGGVEAMIARLKQTETRARIRADIERDGLNNWGRIPSWDCVQISISPHLPQFAGRTLLSIANERKQDPVDTLADYLVDDQGATRVLVTSISEDDIEHIVASPAALVGSDGNCVAPYGQVGKGMPHPRFYGTFPRILHHYVRERGALPLELAIHKMTGATARALKLKDRGLLKQGYRADVAIFDPADFRDRATYADPHQFPSGTRTTVLVNGVPVVEDAKHTEALPGRVLRRDASGAVL